MVKRKATKKKTTKVPHRSTLRRQAPTSLTCVCGDVRDEHGGDLDYPGSTACNVEGCSCCAFEAAR